MSDYFESPTWMAAHVHGSVTVSVRFTSDGTVTVPVSVRRKVDGCLMTVTERFDVRVVPELVAAVLEVANVVVSDTEGVHHQGVTR